MKRTVLYIGGTGMISYSCVLRSLELDWDVTVLNRGKSSSLRPLPPEVHTIVADAFDEDSLRAALAGKEFDVVCDFMSFTADHLQLKLNVIEGHTSQYVFISSASDVGHHTATPTTAATSTNSAPMATPRISRSRFPVLQPRSPTYRASWRRCPTRASNPIAHAPRCRPPRRANSALSRAGSRVCSRS